MSLKEYLIRNKVDDIEDDAEFMETEYNVIHSYCEICSYILKPDDITIIKNRGLADSYENWIDVQTRVAGRKPD